MIAAVIFDFDDTLVVTNPVFEQVKASFYHRMAQLGLADGDLPQVLNEYDIANVRQAGGLAQHCFPLALEQTYQAYCRRKQVAWRPEQAAEFATWGYSVFAQTPRLLPSAQELLTWLAARAPLFLLTQGEKETQTWRLQASGLLAYFERTYIVKAKTAADFARILQENRLPAASTWSIGNSLRTDIYPALTLGMPAVQVDIDCWDYDSACSEEAPGVFGRVENLAGCIQLLQAQEVKPKKE